MSFKGSFSYYSSNRLVQLPMISFRLECTNWMFGETIDVGLFDAYQQNPFFFRDLHFDTGSYMEFNYDTVGWKWYQDDFAAIVDKQNNILQRWTLHLKEYAPGECPECHGTHRCGRCQGQGYIAPPGRLWEAQPCPKCGGTGVCMTCDVPYRPVKPGMGPIGLHPKKI